MTHILIVEDDPARGESPIGELKENYTLIIVTHSLRQARRASRKTACFHLGRLVEEGKSEQIFSAPHDERTRDHVMGRIG